MPDDPSVTRKYEPREQRLVGEFVREFFPKERVKFQVRLGMPRAAVPPSEIPLIENLAALKRRPAADAMVIKPHELIIIESYIKIDLGKVSQLQIYMKLAPMTIDADWDIHLPTRGVIVGALEDPVLTQHARDNGIEFVLYHPSWVDEYLAILAPRFGRNRPPQAVEG